MGFVGLIYSRSTVTTVLTIIGAIVFIVAGVFAFITSAKGRQSRPLVICFMITMICFFLVALIQLIIGAIARSNCGNTNLALHDAACGSGWQYFFALTVILLFTSIIGAAAAFSFWRMLRQEDEGKQTKTKKRRGKIFTLSFSFQVVISMSTWQKLLTKGQKRKREKNERSVQFDLLFFDLMFPLKNNLILLLTILHCSS